MKKQSITRFRLDPKKPPKTDWRAFDSMSKEQRHQAALSDPDNPPATAARPRSPRSDRQREAACPTGR